MAFEREIRAASKALRMDRGAETQAQRERRLEANQQRNRAQLIELIKRYRTSLPGYIKWLRKHEARTAAKQ